MQDFCNVLNMATSFIHTGALHYKQIHLDDSGVPNVGRGSSRGLNLSDGVYTQYLQALVKALSKL